MKGPRVPAGARPARRADAAAAIGAGLCAAALGLFTNWAAALPIPESWVWLRNPVVLWSAVGVLALLGCAFAVRALRSPAEDAAEPDCSGAGSAVHAGSGSVVIVGAHGPVTVPVPAAPPVAAPGQVVVGEIPGEPPAFQDRGELAELRRVLAGGQRVAVVCSLTGARGVGKSQVAAAYARERVRHGCPLVGWVNAETFDGCVAGLAEIAQAVGVADPDGDSGVSAANLRRHLQSRTEAALLVLDNALDVDALRGSLPSAGCCQVIVTSTDHAFSQLGAAIDVSTFSRAQSVAYLRERTGRDDTAGADAVADELGDLPVALAQAASVIQVQALSYPAYLERLRAVPLERILARQPGDPYPRGAAEATLLSITSAVDSDESGLAERLLVAVALLSPTGTARWLLYPLARVAQDPTDPMVVDEVVGRLVGLSLLVWTDGGQGVVMHRLVARILRERAHVTNTLGRAIAAVAEALDTELIPEARAWQDRERGAHLVGHAGAVWEHAASAHPAVAVDQLEPAARVANWAVRHLTTTADLSRAIAVGAALLAAYERVLGPQHPTTRVVRDNLRRATMT